MQSFELVKASTAEEALKAAELKVGDLCRVTSVTASANSTGTFTVRVTGVDKIHEHLLRELRNELAEG